MNIFLSYPSEKSEAAKEVYSYVTGLSLPCWFDRESLLGGQEWDRERAAAQQRADLVLLICSPETVGRPGVIQREIKDILSAAKDRPLGNIYLICLRTEEVGLPDELRRYQWINLYDENWKFRLAQSLKLALTEQKKPAPPQLDLAMREPTSGDVRVIEVHDLLPDWELRAEYLEYARPGRFFELVNARAKSVVLNEYAQYRGFFDTWDGGDGADWSISTEEFYRTDTIVSLRFYHQYYFRGALHPNYGVSSLNIIDRMGEVRLSDVIDERTETYQWLHDYAELDLNRQMVGSGYPKFHMDRLTEVESWAGFKEFSINDKGITLNLSPRNILPHALGMIDVFVPWEYFSGRLSDHFLTIAGKHLGLAE